MSQRESFEENYHNCRARGALFALNACGAHPQYREKCSAVLQSARSPFCVLRFCPIFRARIIMYAPLWEFQSKQVFHLSLSCSFFQPVLSRNEKIVACESLQMACGVFKCAKHTHMHVRWTCF
jgi:hypothetical protein